MLDGNFACCAQWRRQGTRHQIHRPAIANTRRFFGHRPVSSSAIAPSLVGIRVRGIYGSHTPFALRRVSTRVSRAACLFACIDDCLCALTQELDMKESDENRQAGHERCYLGLVACAEGAARAPCGPRRGTGGAKRRP